MTAFPSEELVGEFSRGRWCLQLTQTPKADLLTPGVMDGACLLGDQGGQFLAAVRGPPSLPIREVTQGLVRGLCDSSWKVSSLQKEGFCCCLAA